ncbi:MAG TPA: MGMT family protein [Thermoanaerobaculia bacterium]|jgi:methylated-DNA-protein-cysteine methyltransferase-like protein
MRTGKRKAGRPGGAAEDLEKIRAVVERIPAGRVATYGQVATLAGLPRRARLAGYAMRELPEGSSLPWHRVINAQGRVSRRQGLGVEEGYQRHLLEEEGVLFDSRGRIDLERFGWDPDVPLSRQSGRRSPGAKG